MRHEGTKARRHEGNERLRLAAFILPPVFCLLHSFWHDVIDGIYACEARGDPPERFVELARSVYRLNDRRAAEDVIV